MLDSLKQHLHSELPKPFAQSAQYQKNFKDEEGDDKSKKTVSGAAFTKKKKNQKKPKADVKKLPAASTCDDENPSLVYKANEYQKVRNEYLADAKAELGLTHTEANEAWNDSTQKKRLLGGLSVPELRRRRFIPKGCDHNPWASAA